MKKSKILVFLSVVLMALTSCLGDPEEVTYYDDAAISSFSLTSIPRTVHTTTKAGKDSTYVASMNATGYKFTIDHNAGLVFNADSLPVGCNASKVIASVTALNGGYVLMKKIDSDTIVYYNTTDTIDFSKPRTFRILANSGEWYKEYKAEVRVHKENGDSVYWTSHETNAAFANLENIKAAALGSKMMAWGVEDGKMKMYATENTDGESWNEVSTPLSASATVVGNEKMLFAYSDGAVYSTDNALAWTKMSEQAGIASLAFATDAEVYAITTDKKIIVSRDGGASWAEDAMDDNADLLPTRDITGMQTIVRTNNDITRVVMIGNRNVATDKNAMVWTKVIDTDNPLGNQPWTTQVNNTDGYHLTPAASPLNIIRYGDDLYMLNGDGINASSVRAMTGIYKSQDNAQNWWKDTRFNLPKYLSSSTTSFAMAKDTRNHIWVICGRTGQVWSCRLAKMTW